MAGSTFNSNQSAKAGLLLLAFIIIWVSISLKLLSPPEVVPAAASNDQFSAVRASEYLKVIAAEPHSSGTPAHAKVRDYILDFCKEQGLETQLQDITGLQILGKRARAGRAQNILARLPGTSPGKSILVMSHYDSQPNTPGASDDGAGVAAMMEVMRLLKAGSPLKNDILFLFTDLEESGLFGAEGFVSHYEALNKIGLLLNFESRGNAGVTLTFEVTDNNSWLMHNFARAVGRAFANSVGYEVYKRMPNGSDFTRFRETGIEGYNSAFIDGFTYYHSMADRLENMDLRSLQNHGDVLLRSLKHFGNLSLNTPHPKENAIFFNPLGNWLWIYPVSWDIPLMVICLLLFVVVMAIGIKRGRIKILRSLAGVGLFLAFALTSMILVWLFEKGVLMMYPYYSNFDELNSYNAIYYLISISGIVLLCFTMWYSKAVMNSTFESLSMGGIFVLIAIMICIKLFFPTGAYMLHYPLIIALGAYLVLYLFNIQAGDKPLLYSLFQIALLIPALSLWVPIIYILFVTFSHTIPLAAVAITLFCVPLLLPSFRIILSYNRRAVVSVAVILILSGVGLAQLYSGYSKEKPLPTYLAYLLDADTNSASWASEQEVPDEWLKQFIRSGSKEEFEWYRGFKWTMWRGDAPVTKSNVGDVKILKDTLYNKSRFLKLLITGDSTTNTIDFTLSPRTFVQKVNDRILPDSIWRLSFWSMPAKGIEVELKTVPGQLVSMSVIERKIGLPNSLIEKNLPDNMIYGQGTLSNTTQIRRKVRLQ